MQRGKSLDLCRSEYSELNSGGVLDLHNVFSDMPAFLDCFLGMNRVPNLPCKTLNVVPRVGFHRNCCPAL